MHILLTGGAGYIGSHTAIELLEAGHMVSLVDNFSNSSPEAVQRIKKITSKEITLHKLDITDEAKLEKLIKESGYDAVIHFAALKSVGESVTDPVRYYANNVGGTISLLRAISGSAVKKVIFSSSATVYGDSPVPYTESTPRSPENPYGNTKYVCELLMEDFAVAYPEIAMIALRYFNPIGAHPSGEIGEDPNGIPSNLMPFITQVASGKRKELVVFGDDYPTPDGTAMRDYIHVVDLARGHLAALEKSPDTGFHGYNLGSGHAESVMDVISAFEAASSKQIPYHVGPRRPGDLAAYYADASLAKQELGWSTSFSLADACRDTWNWQSQSPNGYHTHAEE